MSFIWEQSIAENSLIVTYKSCECKNQRNSTKVTMVFELNSALNNSFAICNNEKCENDRSWVEKIK